MFVAGMLSCLMIQAQNYGIGIQLSSMDKSADPKKDFLKFANGNWYKTASIPASEAAYGSFSEIKERNEKNLRAILNEAATDKSATLGTNRQKIGTLYNLFLDTVKLEKEGIQPLKDDIAAIQAIKTKEDLIKMFALLHSQGVKSGFGFAVEADMKNSNSYAEYFAQSGFNLPEKNFYFLPQYEGIRSAYQKHMERIFTLYGNDAATAKKNAQAVYAIEKSLAEVAMANVEMRNVEALYNLYTHDEFEKQFPNLQLDLYLKSCGINQPLGSFIVTQPKFFAGLNNLLNTVSLEDWKTYLIWDLFTETSAYLNKAFRDEHFEFFSKTLNGIGVQKPRWKQGIEGVDHTLGEALGQIYVERHFNDEAKKRVNVMVDNLTAAFKMRINASQWMSNETKVQAQDKLSKFTRKLGFPDKWKDYSSLEIKNDALVTNLMRARNFMYREMIAYVGKPVDKTKWGMSPPTVNAYYNPNANEIVFPAGIMQPPFFDPKADDAFNYGIMGSIIGHELSHGFDDEGSKFDGDGNLKNWWSESDLKQFEERTNVLVNQFNACVAIDTMHVNGRLTLGENIADLGGLTMAYYAYQLSLGGKKSDVREGFTGEQRFFIAWAQGWKSLMRPAFLKQMVATNPHSPADFRAYMPLTNMPEFYQAFGVTEKDPMFRAPEKRAVIW